MFRLAEVWLLVAQTLDNAITVMSVPILSSTCTARQLWCLGNQPQHRSLSLMLCAGLHGFGSHPGTATMTLAPGPHALRVDYFQGPGYVGLMVLMSTTTAAAAQPISPSMLSHPAVRGLRSGLAAMFP